MATVIDEAAVSAGTVYRYFPSKTDLIRACAAEVSSGVTAVLQEIQDRNALSRPEDVVERLLEAAFDVGRRLDVDLGRIVVSIWAECVRDPELKQTVGDVYADLRIAIAGIVRSWVASSDRWSKDDPELMAQVLFGAIPGYIVQHLLIGDVTPQGYTRGLIGLGRLHERVGQ